MRVSQQTKHETQHALLATAQRLFLARGLEAVSTREIASAAGVGVGTLFNYFPTKEALAWAIASAAFDAGRATARERIEHDARSHSDLSQDLFTLIACDIRALESVRTLIPGLLDAGLGAWGTAEGAPGSIRVQRLADADALLVRHGRVEHSTPALLHLYWSLYLGVLAFWTKDTSPNQEDTWALLDQGVRMFAGSIPSTVNAKERER